MILQRQYISPTRLNDLEVDPPPARMVAEDKKKEGTLGLWLEDRPVRAGTDVVGQVRMELNAKITAKMIAVRLVGCEGSPGSKSGRDLFQGAPGYQRHGLLVVVYDGSKDKLFPGSYNWPFSIRLPSNTPMSYSDQRTVVSYTLEVFVDIPFWPDMNASYPIEVFPSQAQHAAALNGQRLVPTSTYRPIAPLLCATPLLVSGSTGILCCSDNFSVSLSATDPVVLPFQDGQFGITASLKIHPTHAPIITILAVIEEVTRNGATVIASQTIPYDRSGLVPLRFTLGISENDLQLHLHHLYRRPIRKASQITCYSFTSHMASRNYVLRVGTTTDGLFTSSLAPIVAEIPVFVPLSGPPQVAGSAPAQQQTYVAGSFYGASTNAGFAQQPAQAFVTAPQPPMATVAVVQPNTVFVDPAQIQIISSPPPSQQQQPQQTVTVTSPQPIQSGPILRSFSQEEIPETKEEELDLPPAYMP